MDKKALLRKRIDEKGLDNVSKLIRMPVFQLIDFCDYPINTPKVIHEILYSYFKTISDLPGGGIYYKEYAIRYENFEGLLTWNDGLFVDKNGGGISFEIYATPFYDGEPVVPIAISNVWGDNIDGDDVMILTDEIPDIDDYYSVYPVDYKKLDSGEKIMDWFKNVYLPKTYQEIRKLTDKLSKDHDL
jgi:hypothetical protein